MTTDAADPQHAAEARESLLEAMDRLYRDSGPEGLTLAELMEQLGERAFGAALFALALPCVIPFLYVVPQIVALPMMAFAGQLAMGRPQPWLPKKFAARRIDRNGLKLMSREGRRFFGWAEKIAVPRLLFLTGPRAERVVGAFMTFFCVSILTPLPGTNSVPGFGVALASLGLMERDGLMVLGGLVIGTLWIAGLVFVASVGLTVIVDTLRALFGM